MFTILLFIVFTTCILAAPAQNQTSIQWSKYKENKSLEHYQSTLLNETILPFLDECYNTTLLAQNHQTKEIICSRYFDGILQLNSSGYIVNASTVLKLRDQANMNFCDQKHNFPGRKYFLNINRLQIDLNNKVMCGHVCLEDDSTPKSICRFLAWMGDVITNNSMGYIKHNTELQVAPVVPKSNTAEPTKVSQVDNSSKVSHTTNGLSNKTIDGLQVKTTETIKTDAIVKKLDLIPSKALEKPEPKQLFETPPNKLKQIKDDSKGDNELAKQNLDGNNGDIGLANQPLDEGKSDIALATSNSSAQDPSKLAQPPKSKDENPMDASDAFDTEDDQTSVDENADDANANANTRIPIANPENEENHSSSQEIINSKVIAATTTTTNKKIDPFHEQSGSNFFTYFLVGMFLCIAMYVSYHNKSKILALVLEGRRGDKGRSGRRKHTAAYRKLDSNLEEAITSSARGRTTQIIY